MNYFSVLKHTALCLASILLVSLLSACGSSSSSESASLRIVHASPDAADIDALLDDSLVLNNLPYFGASDYISVVPGTSNIKVNAADTDLTMINADVSFAANSRNTIFATGLFAENDIQPIVLMDGTEQPAAGEASLRILHAAPSALSIDLYATEAGEALNETSPFLSSFPFRAFTGYTAFPAGTYQLQTTEVGTLNPLMSPENLVLNEGDIATLVFREAAGGGAPYSFIVLNDR